MTPQLRKIGLTCHIVSSVGWLGAVGAFLTLSIAGLTSGDAGIVRSAYVAMNLIGEFIIVPLSLATLTTGLIQSIGTEWGLLRYYWVLTKFVLTFGATFLLLLHQFTAVAEAAKRISGIAAGEFPSAGGLGLQLVIDASLAIIVLLTATVLSVFKPWGKIPYGRIRPQDERSPSSERPALVGSTPQDAVVARRQSWRGKLVLAVVALIGIAFIVIHLMGGGLHRHGL